MPRKKKAEKEPEKEEHEEAEEEEEDDERDEDYYTAKGKKKKPQTDEEPTTKRRRSSTGGKAKAKKGKGGEDSYALPEVDSEKISEKLLEKAGRAAAASSPKKKKTTRPSPKKSSPKKKKKTKERDELDEVTQDASPASTTTKKKKAEEEEGKAPEKAPPTQTLLGKIITGRDVTVAKEWAKKYEENNVAGVVELINLVIEASGLPDRITAEQYESGDATAVINSLLDSIKRLQQKGKEKEPEKEKEKEEEEKEAGADKASGCIFSGKTNRKQRERFEKFWERVVYVSKDGFLFDDCLLAVLTSWLGALANFPEPTCRLTATVAALQVTRSLIEVAKEIGESQEKNARQKGSEKRRSGGGEPSSKMKRLEQLSEELAEHAETLGTAINEFFENVVTLRYRDVVAEVRVLCIAALSEFIAEWPERLLPKSYLKYVAWGLNDRSPDVRLAAVRGLQAIYAACGEGAPEELEKFTDRSKARIVQMTLDTSPAVAVEDIALCRTLATVMGALDEDDLKRIYGLVSDENPEVRRAAGAFAHAVAFPSVDAEHISAGEGEGEAEAEAGLAEARIRGVLEMTVNYSAIPDMPCYVVDALWASASSVLRDWNTMTAMLLRDAEGEGALTEREQALLAGVLSAACRKAANIQITYGPPGPAPSAEKQQVIQGEMTAELARQLPRLFEKYADDKDVVAELAEAVVALSLPHYAALRLERHMTDLLERLCQLYARHSSDDVMSASAAALRHLVSRDKPHKQSAEAEATVRTLAERIHAAIDASDAEALAVGLRRLLHLSQNFDLGALGIDAGRHAEPLLEAWTSGDTSAASQSDAVCTAASLLYHRVLWDIATVGNTSAAPPERAEAIAKHSRALVEQLEKILSTAESSPRALVDIAFASILDIASLLSQRFEKTALGPFTMALSPETISSIRKYFYEQVTVPLSKAPAPVPVPAPGGEQQEPYSECREERLATCYAKAILMGALDEDHAAALLSLYHRYEGKDARLVSTQKKVDKLVAATLQKLRDALHSTYSLVVFRTLQRCFEDEEGEDESTAPKPTAKEEGDEEGEVSTEKEKEKPSHLWEVAKWLAASYGPSPRELRGSMVQAVKDAVNWALDSGNHSRLGLLAGLIPLVNKFQQNEAKDVAELLAKKREEKGLKLSDHPQDTGYFDLKKQLDLLAEGKRPKSTVKRGKTKSRGKVKAGKLDLEALDDDEGDTEASTGKKKEDEELEESRPSAKKKKKEAEEKEETEPEPLRRSPRKTPKKDTATPKKVELEEDEEDMESSQPKSKRKKSDAVDEEEKEEEEEETKEKKKTPKKTPSSKKKTPTKKRTK